MEEIKPAQPVNIEPAKHSHLNWLFLVVFIITISFISMYSWLKLITKETSQEASTSRKDSSIAQITTTPKPSPTPIPLTPGKGEYSISHAKSAGPKITKVIFNPLDVHKGEQLTVSLQMTSVSPITSVEATLNTDVSPVKLVFTKTSRNNEVEVWSSSVQLPYSVLYQYVFNATAKNDAGITSIIVAPRS